jgi:hypothetical protein
LGGMCNTPLALADRISKRTVPLSSFELNTLTGNPRFEVSVYKPHPSSSQFHERDATLLHEASNESLRTPKPLRCASNV